MIRTFYSTSEEETISIGRNLSALVGESAVIALTGDLGAGKTQLVKGIASAKGIDDRIVNSPTFSVVNVYEGPVSVLHFDFYRIEKEEELWDIGIEEYWQVSGLKLIEWAEKFPSVIPPVHFTITISVKPDLTREIQLEDHQ